MQHGSHFPISVEDGWTNEVDMMDHLIRHVCLDRRTWAATKSVKNGCNKTDMTSQKILLGSHGLCQVGWLIRRQQKEVEEVNSLVMGNATPLSLCAKEDISPTQMSEPKETGMLVVARWDTAIQTVLNEERRATHTSVLTLSSHPRLPDNSTVPIV